ncbi:hypothetical protein ACJ72_08276 [Emergomyces africanus]|uniref:Uncharacterized protein n=1 Tax=Emergomyces africanus TaxID=1955775 RepID=A0A1B7NLC7_9EURO|nr:hypothetical protein ACJ72_08276 [Emergomyces africanus]
MLATTPLGMILSERSARMPSSRSAMPPWIQTLIFQLGYNKHLGSQQSLAINKLELTKRRFDEGFRDPCKAEIAQRCLYTIVEEEEEEEEEEQERTKGRKSD